MLLVLLTRAFSFAAKHDVGCPAAACGIFRVDRDGWRDRTVEGFEEAAIPVYNPDGSFTDEFDAFAAAFGLVTAPVSRT
jgi:hypothetical protein